MRVLGLESSCDETTAAIVDDGTIVRSDVVASQHEVHARYGWECAGAWETLMVDESECFVLWALPTWEAWAEHEKARRRDAAQVQWRAAARDLVTDTSRIVLIDSPLCPFKTGRQPARSDRTEEWDEG